MDVNPFAVAIARFRLIVAALHACGDQPAEQRPRLARHVAIGDACCTATRSTGRRVPPSSGCRATSRGRPDLRASRTPTALERILDRQYHAVVGNPPYITVKDTALNERYRERCTDLPPASIRWRAVHRAVLRPRPRCRRTVDRPGYVGMITANSFMKREFGKKLIEEFFPTVDLTHVIDTSVPTSPATARRR